MNWKLNDDEVSEHPFGDCNFWYDLTDGGYIKPELILTDKDQALELQKAINLVLSFQRAIDARFEELCEMEDANDD